MGHLYELYLSLTMKQLAGFDTSRLKKLHWLLAKKNGVSCVGWC